MGERGLPIELASNSQATALGDVDGDGDLDLIVGRTDEQTRLYRNDGEGLFTDVTAGRLPAAVLTTAAVAFGDIDGDGDLDLALGNRNGAVVLYRNDGTGTFADVSATLLPGGTFACTALAFGDLDNDGDLDLLLANQNRQSQLLVNNGAGAFSEQTAPRLPALSVPATSVVLGDLDNDGDLDVVLGTSLYFPAPQLRVLRNNNGVFADVTASTCPLTTDITTSLALGDVDGDGDLDLILGNTRFTYQFTPNPQTRLYRNDGTGVFTDATLGRIPSDGDQTSAVALHDIDGDGDLDLVIGNRGTAPGQQNRLYRNDGTGTFINVTASQLPAVADATSALAFGDVDGDGDADLVVANGHDSSSFFTNLQDRLLLNDGAGVFLDAAAARVPATQTSLFAIAHGDFDGDGDEDLIGAGPAGPATLFRNDGKGGLRSDPVGSMPVLPSQTTAIAVGDLDGDGDLDVVTGGVSTSPSSCQLLRNDGFGTFTNVTIGQMPPLPTSTRALALIDVDGDGDLDLLLGNSAQQSRLYRNDGAATFTDVTAAQFPAAPTQRTTSIATGDFDGDGDMDVVLGVTGDFYSPAGGQNRLYRNNGAGAFTDATAAGMPVISDHTDAIVAGDIDGDGDLDLVSGDSSAYYSSGQNRLLRNNGAGVFTPVGGLPLVIGTTISLAFADGDGDGDLDLLVGRGRNVVTGSGADDYFVNAGNGQFNLVTARTPLADASTAAVAMADMDRDGDLELIVCRGAAIGGSTLDVFTNLVRQLETPQLLRIGRTFRFEAYARYGRAGPNDIAFPFFSPFEASFVVPPFGFVGIDPGAAVALPAIVVSQPAGLGSLDLPIPYLAALLGVPVHFQAILSQQPVQDRLTNVITKTIVR